MGLNLNKSLTYLLNKHNSFPLIVWAFSSQHALFKNAEPGWVEHSEELFACTYQGIHVVKFVAYVVNYLTPYEAFLVLWKDLDKLKKYSIEMKFLSRELCQ